MYGRCFNTRPGSKLIPPEHKCKAVQTKNYFLIFRLKLYFQFLYGILIWVPIGNFIVGPSGEHLDSDITLKKRETVSVWIVELSKCCNLRFTSSIHCSNKINLIVKLRLGGHDVATWLELFWVLRFQIVQINQNRTMAMICTRICMFIQLS